MRCGIGCDLLEERAVGLLDDRVVVQARPHLLDPGGEPVAHLLELVDREHPRATQARDLEVNALPREGRPEQAGERELQGRDLTPQIGARGALVVLDQDGVEALRWRRRDNRLLRCDPHLVDLGAFEKLLRHTSKPPGRNGSR